MQYAMSRDYVKAVCKLGRKVGQILKINELFNSHSQLLGALSCPLLLFKSFCFSK